MSGQDVDVAMERCEIMPESFEVFSSMVSK